MVQNSEGKDMAVMLDPLQYIGRIKRADNGRARTMEIFYDDDMIHVEDGDEFVTFRTDVLLENDEREP